MMMPIFEENEDSKEPTMTTDQPDFLLADIKRELQFIDVLFSRLQRSFELEREHQKRAMKNHIRKFG